MAISIEDRHENELEGREGGAIMSLTQVFFTTVSATSQQDLQRELRNLEKTYHSRTAGGDLTYEVIPDPSKVKFADLVPQVFNVTAYAKDK